MIHTQLKRGISPAASAVGSTRSASTRSRELRRNGGTRSPTRRGPGRPPVAGGSRADAARPRARGEDRSGWIPDRVRSHDRPPAVEERLLPAHWESDLIKGAHNYSAVGTLVERSTLFTVLAQMDNVSAESAVKDFGPVLIRIEAQMRLSLTNDQGREMAALGT